MINNTQIKISAIKIVKQKIYTLDFINLNILKKSRKMSKKMIFHKISTFYYKNKK